MRMCQTLEEVTKAAVDLVDNCEFYEDGLRIWSEESETTKTIDLEDQGRSLGQSKAKLRSKS